MIFDEQEQWLLDKFQVHGVEYTEDLINESDYFTEKERKELLIKYKKLIWRMLLNLEREDQ